MTQWITKHKETIGIIAVILGALGAGVFAGFVLIVLANLIGLL